MAEQIQKNRTTKKAPAVIEPMPESTPSATESESILGSLDEAIAAASSAGDDALLNAVRGERVQVVASTGRSAFQSAESRAWTMGGAVD
jgi:hypothetical protein